MEMNKAAALPPALAALFEQYAGTSAEETVAFPSSGSSRRYFRLRSGACSAVGVCGADAGENRAFIGLSRHFRSKGLPVPQVYAQSADGLCYLQEDLGDTSLFDAVSQGRERGGYSEAEAGLLRRTVEMLPRFQCAGAEGLDWSLCYPQEAFDGRTVDFDLNYFKYCFLKTSGLEFNEIRLQDDFDRLKADLLEDSGEPTFMYRDFQARNVMLRDGEPWFIDFQGGRRGPLCYDLASFLWQARSRFPDTLREELVEHYLQALRAFRPVDGAAFRRRLRLFVLFRSLQVLGAYGFRGRFEKKPHFLSSIPCAIDQLRTLLQTPFPAYPYLSECLLHLCALPQFAAEKRLEVQVVSFSYKKGIPADASGNGGGYVFDCRGIHNPGKYEYYRAFTGRDPEVIRFLEDDGEVSVFLDSVYRLADAHAARYLERGFTHLQFCFGCTGGQHRSVYCAEHLARHLAEKYRLRVRLTHRELSVDSLL